MDEIGTEAAERLLKDEPTNPFTQVAKDIRTARKAIVARLKATQHNQPGAKNGFVVNAMGKGISGTESDAKILSFVLQGMDARMLSVILEHCSKDIFLLQYDGVST